MDDRMNGSRVADHGPEVADGGQYEGIAPHKRSQSPARRNPFSLGPFLSGLLIGLAITIIVVAAVGGGLGGSLAACRQVKSFSSNVLPAAQITTVQTTTVKLSPTTTETPISSSSSSSLLSNYAPAATSAVSTLAINCPALDNQETITHFGDKFPSYCGEDFTAGLTVDGRGVIADIAGIVAYSVTEHGGTYQVSLYILLDQSQQFHIRLGGKLLVENATFAVGVEATFSNFAVSAKLQ